MSSSRQSRLREDVLNSANAVENGREQLRTIAQEFLSLEDPATLDRALGWLLCSVRRPTRRWSSHSPGTPTTQFGGPHELACSSYDDADEGAPAAAPHSGQRSGLAIAQSFCDVIGIVKVMPSAPARPVPALTGTNSTTPESKRRGSVNNASSAGLRPFSQRVTRDHRPMRRCRPSATLRRRAPRKRDVVRRPSPPR